MSTVGSLFSGIGGLDLGLERAGWEVKWQVEIDEWCRRVLTKHWPDVPKYGDVRRLSGDDLEPVDLIAGGFPCQPVSLAGRRKAQADPRWLWPEFIRIVSEVRPGYVLVENVPGLLHQGMAEVLGDLSSCGYDTEWDCIPAAAIGAPHLRYRVFIAAYARGAGVRLESGRGRYERPAGLESAGEEAVHTSGDGSDGTVAHTDGQRLPQWEKQELLVQRSAPVGSGADAAHPYGEPLVWTPITREEHHPWAVEPDVRGVVNGLPERLDSDLDGGDGMDTVGGSLAASEDGVRTLRECWAEVGAASQGRESDEQLARQLADAVSQMPHDDPLGKREGGMEATRFVFRLRQACSQVEYVPNPCYPLLQIWQSLSEEDKSWAFMAVCGGIWLNEWPSVTRIASGIPSRVDRLRGLGNAVVPQVAEWIGRRILDGTNLH